MDGHRKHIKEKPMTLNGCLLLVEYWFLENRKHRAPHSGIAMDKPRFVLWSVKDIFNLKVLERKLNLVEELITQGPWKKGELEIVMINETQEDKGFQEWMPQAVS